MTLPENTIRNVEDAERSLQQRNHIKRIAQTLAALWQSANGTKQTDTIGAEEQNELS